MSGIDTINMKKMLADRGEYVLSVLKKYLPADASFATKVAEAMEYSVEVGGKRLRPILLMEVNEAFGGDRVLAEPFLAAVECIHTYSLIHDDLPAMDNDVLRRGKDTTWVAYGEDTAILAGDGLLNLAFEIMSCAVAEAPEDKCRSCARAMQVMADKAGIFGMIGGQGADLAAEGRQASKEELLFIHKNKTCALMEASMMAGAILAGAKEEEVRIVEKVAYGLGMAFQIRDDILDVAGDADKLGKPVGSDIKNQKNTYVSLMGMQKSEEEVKRYTQEAVSAWQSLAKENRFLEDLMLYLTDREM